MNKEINAEQRIQELESKNQFYKLKRYEKKELKFLRKKLKEKKEEEKKKKLKLIEEEKEKTKEIKKKIIQKHFESKSEIKKENKEKKGNKDVKELIEDMCVLSSITKKEIIKEKKENPKKFIGIDEAIKEPNRKSSTFIMGLLGKKLEDNGVTVAIERNNDSISSEETSTLLQFMVNGLGSKKKYDLHFDINEKRNEELLNDKEEQNKFIAKLKKKLSISYNIPEDEIIITNPQRGSFQLSIVFKSKDFDLTKTELLSKFKDDKELGTIKDIQSDILISACKITQNMFDYRGNNTDGGWGYNEKRGGEPYTPPEGWIGYGLKVWDKYDLDKGAKCNDWLSYDNREGEWCVAYHGAGHEKESSDVANIIKNVAKSNLKIGTENDYADDDDIKHPGKKVGNGVYCSPNPKVMEGYAGIIEANNEKYKMGFMVRVNPSKIRVSAGNLDFWVLDGNDDDIRPYRILIKKI